MTRCFIIVGMMMLAVSGCRSSKQVTETAALNETMKLNATHSSMSVATVELDSLCLTIPFTDTTGSHSPLAMVVEARKVKVNAAASVATRVEKADSTDIRSANISSVATAPLSPVGPLVWVLFVLQVGLLLFTVWWVLHNHK